MKFQRKQRVESGIDVTPLIDVVFLMLIFFMVSTTFTREAHLQLTLPEADATPSVDEGERLEIIVSATGTYALNGKVLVNTQIETVMAALRDQSGGDTAQPLVITADAKATHELVVRVMDAAGRLGFVNLSITTRLPDEGG
ncbi:MAG: biopolymer transporter ExbD [Gammaproteobacteria bacterium]|nr:biopolymer transporter ExbD [Gammaproteobacteria bacterium]MBP6051309.1 biopolymer transporter ExbD [Pseudomonadales bacterium]MBK6581655.1 biopolymer transporter ExbD [Gammaproteobacteria bacterium]MBK7170505.1 biopolymer transporter ExbD [Gammaproteobacteria bacterium]MBK7522415.1 biopolymer transporter ExbD [Gammaproteobacteria bacterium]